MRDPAPLVGLVPLQRRDVQAALLLAGLLLLGAGFRAHTDVCGQCHDDGIYVLNAKSLAEGNGYRITNLPGAELGEAVGNTIYLDINAAGYGWFVDPTPSNDSEFTTPGNQGEMNRMDLLTVLEHELGHILGYDHTGTGLMSPTLATGIRETPTAVIDQFFAG